MVTKKSINKSPSIKYLEFKKKSIPSKVITKKKSDTILPKNIVAKNHSYNNLFNSTHRRVISESFNFLNRSKDKDLHINSFHQAVK